MASLFEDVVTGARTVEIPEGLPWQVAGVTIALKEEHVADAAFVNKFHGCRPVGIMAQLEADLEDAFRILGGVHQHAALLGVEPQRFFLINVLADFKRGHGHLLVEVHGRRDHHGINIFAVEHLTVLGIRIGRVARRGGFIHGFLQGLGIDVADRDHFDARHLQHVLEQV